MNPRKLLGRIESNQNSIRFSDVVRLVSALGFAHDRTSGSHQIFIHTRIPAAQLNLQSDKNGEAKAYQVRQLLKLIEEYNLTL